MTTNKSKMIKNELSKIEEKYANKPFVCWKLFSFSFSFRKLADFSAFHFSAYTSLALCMFVCVYVYMNMLMMCKFTR